MWDKLFKNGPSKNCGRQPLSNLNFKFLKAASTNFTWSILEYFDPEYAFEYASGLKVHYCRFEILPISSSSYENNMLKISH